MITADKFYTCDDAMRVALALGDKYLLAVSSVTPHSYSASVDRTLSGGVAESWMFDFLKVPYTSGQRPRVNLFFGTLTIDLYPTDVPSGTYQLSVDFNIGGDFFRVVNFDSGNNPITTVAPISFQFHNVILNNANVQYNLQIADLAAVVAIQFNGYKISQ